MATSASTTTTTTQDSSGGAAVTQGTTVTASNPSTRPSTVIEIITAVAKKLGVDPNLAIADAYVESGLNPSNDNGDGGVSGGLYQLNTAGGEGEGMTWAQINNPTTNATTALTRFAAVGKANPGASPGAVAFLAQRPAAFVNGRKITPYPTTPAEAEQTDYAKTVNSVYTQVALGTPPAQLTTAGGQTPSNAGTTGSATTVDNSGAVLTDAPVSGAGAWLFTLDGLMNIRPSHDPLAQLFGIFDVNADVSSVEQFGQEIFVRAGFLVAFTGIFLTGVYLVSPASVKGIVGTGVKRNILGRVTTGSAERVAAIATERSQAEQAERSRRAEERASAGLARDKERISAQEAADRRRHEQTLERDRERTANKLKETAAVGRRSRARIAEENAKSEKIRQDRLRTNARARARRP